jgi:hypothetical protein
MNTKQRLEWFDQTINTQIKNKNWKQLTDHLVNVLGNHSDVSINRKYTIRNILISNLEIFKQTFLSLSHESDTFFGVKCLKNVISPSLHSHLANNFHTKMTQNSSLYTRIDGRRRLFVDKNQLSDTEKNQFSTVVKKTLPSTSNLTLEKILYESITPIDVPNVNTSFWHIDSLTDQLKIVIPINKIHSLNGPMKHIDGIQSLNDYSYEIWQKLHTAYKISGLSVSNANYFEDQVIESATIKTIQAETGDVIVFNPQVIHSGNLCQCDMRNTITLYYHVETNRNKCLENIH